MMAVVALPEEKERACREVSREAMARSKFSLQ